MGVKAGAAGRYAIPANNFNNVEQLEAIHYGRFRIEIPGDLTMLGQRYNIHEFNTWMPVSPIRTT